MISKIKNFFKRHITLKSDKTVEIEDIRFIFNQNDSGGSNYENRSSIEERRNLLYGMVSETLNPHLVIDVGANYGFTAVIFSICFPKADLILIEPDPRLGEYIKNNMQINGAKNYKLLQAICSDDEVSNISFGLNPYSSQDNRVNGLQGWSSIEVQSVTLDSILNNHLNKRVFVKIDTQGFEPQVFKGAEDFLCSSNDWFIKTEFAPDWLESQNNSPEELLEYLISRYMVIEAPARTRFKGDHLSTLFSTPLTKEDIGAFTNHVKSLNKNGLGWVDLYLAPKGAISGWLNEFK